MDVFVAKLNSNNTEMLKNFKLDRLKIAKKNASEHRRYTLKFRNDVTSFLNGCSKKLHTAGVMFHGKLTISIGATKK